MENNIQRDKFKAVWLSHSSIADFLKCPRSYYLRSVYKDPRSGHRITVMTPPLALGQAVHDVLDSISNLGAEERFTIPLTKKLDVVWQKIEGKKGGFKTSAVEMEYKDRGRQMLKRVEENPGILREKAIKIKADGGLPWYWLNDTDNLILCGKVDWLVYKQESDSVHILDFKTGKNEEEEDSLQLPIYYLLVKNLQNRNIEGASYWYLDKNDTPIAVNLPDEKKAFDTILEIAQKIKLARQLQIFKCPFGGCRQCMALERVVAGEGEKVAVSEYNQDLYVL